MDLRALRQFMTVAECGSYSRGSELLRISQPAVSRTIKNLEVDLGRPLFRRHGHGVTLTEAGQRLLERAQQILRDVERTTAEIRSGSSGPSGVLSIAVPPAAGRLLAPELVRRFARDFPNVHLRIVGGFSGYIHEWLVRGQVDLACVHDPLPQRGFEVAPLVNEEVFLVGRAGDFPEPAGPIRVESLKSFPLIIPSRQNASRRMLESLALSQGLTLSTCAEVDDHTIIRALLNEGLGFTLLTDSALAGGRSGLQLRSFDPRLSWTLSLLTVQSKPQSEIVGHCMAAVKDIVASLVAAARWPGALAIPSEPEVIRRR